MVFGLVKAAWPTDDIILDIIRAVIVAMFSALWPITIPLVGVAAFVWLGGHLISKYVKKFVGDKSKW